MKRIILLFFTVFLITTCYSQRFIGSVIAGMNLSQVDGDEVYGFHKAGFNGGASVMLPLDARFKWFATVELLYSQRGSYRSAWRANDSLSPSEHIVNEDNSIPFNDKIKYKLNLDYVEVPIVFHYEDFRTGWALGAGFSWGRLVYAKEIENGWTTTTNIRSKTYTTNDWSVLADLKIKIWKGVKLNVRYQYSFVPIRERNFEYKQPDGTIDKTELRKQYHSVISFRLIYSFNEKYIKNSEWIKGGKNGPRWIRDTSKSFYK
ncbi:MAG: PorT family protein [Bacteroidales bacterium]|nr:PorT family protein [Bacteroidales bacterium]